MHVRDGVGGSLRCPTRPVIRQSVRCRPQSLLPVHEIWSTNSRPRCSMPAGLCGKNSQTCPWWIRRHFAKMSANSCVGTRSCNFDWGRAAAAASNAAPTYAMLCPSMPRPVMVVYVSFSAYVRAAWWHSNTMPTASGTCSATGLSSIRSGVSASAAGPHRSLQAHPDFCFCAAPV
jgi:hypothetical protein